MDKISAALSSATSGSNRYWDNQVKLEDIKKLLESPTSEKDNVEGMKHCLVSISKGRDVASLYPSVAKLVASQNPEIKKLVHIFLVHYAEMEPDLALLAISTLQKELANPNQLIRANALRTVSSIRVKIIAQLVGLAIKKAATDSSPYVRKTAAHAVLKVTSLDPEQTESMIEVVGGLLKDSAQMVLGAAVAAFNQLCPTKYELVHGNYRKLCMMVCDFDEWGQIEALNLLTRYIRSQFVDPKQASEDKKALKAEKKAAKAAAKAAAQQANGKADDSDSDSDDDLTFEFETAEGLEPDHKLLLKAAVPLLQSRNSGVVMAVAALYHYCGPRTEQQKIARALLRILRSRREIQYVILNGIVNIASTNPEMFRGFVHDFYIQSTDPAFIRTLKLDILTLLASDATMPNILREFKTYVTDENKQFAKAAIQAIGRCATRLPEVAETCMQFLTSLMGNRSDTVVAESVIVIKQLLQMPQIATAVRKAKIPTAEEKKKSRRHHPRSSRHGSDDEEEEEDINAYGEVIMQMTRLLDTVTNAQARAAIVWIIAEHVEQLAKLAPDVLRKLAKSFTTEEEIVKLQALTLGAKLFLTNPDQTSKLFTYVMTLAKYDQNYDVRDRCRVIRRLLIQPQGKADTLAQHTHQLFLTQKPVPQLQPLLGEDAEGHFFRIGTISSLVRHTAPKYISIPNWAAEPTNPELRNPPRQEWEQFSYGGGTRTFGGFGSDSLPPQGFGSGSMPGFGPGSMPPGTARGTAASNAAMMGYKSREQYEKDFWGDGSDDEEKRGRSRSPSGSRSGSSRSRSYSRSRSWSGSRSHSGSRSRSRSASRSRTPSPAPPATEQGAGQSTFSEIPDAGQPNNSSPVKEASAPDPTVESTPSVPTFGSSADSVAPATSIPTFAATVIPGEEDETPANN